MKQSTLKNRHFASTPETALGAGGRQFKSDRPDQHKQIDVGSPNNKNQIAGIYGLNYDQNGNAYNVPSPSNPSSYFILGYDAENRMISESQNVFPSPTYTYAYDAQNKRIFSWTGNQEPVGNNATGYQLFLYSPGGQKLGAYQIDVVNPSGYGSLTLTSTLIASDLYFGSRRLAVQDRLGSVGNYFPYGEARVGTNPQDTWSFATYWRDSVTSLDYADQRYYSNQFGRFMTPDPYRAATGSVNNPPSPQSWNKYAYTQDDPVNFYDPRRLELVYAGTVLCLAGYGPEGRPEYTNCDIFVDASGPLRSREIPSIDERLERRAVSWLSRGQEDAKNDLLTKGDCAAFISSVAGGVPLSGSYLAGVLSATQVSLSGEAGNDSVTLTPTGPIGSYQYRYQTAYTVGGNIFFNANYFPDPTQQNITVPGGTTSLLALVKNTLGSDMTAEQLDTYVFLHELSHIVDPTGANSAIIDSDDFNKAIISKCIK